MQPLCHAPFNYQRLAALLETSHLYVHRMGNTVIITHWCAQFCTEIHELLRPFQPECEGSFFCWPLAQMGFRPESPGIEQLWCVCSKAPSLTRLHLTKQLVRLGHGFTCRVLSGEQGKTIWIQRDLTDVLQTSLPLLTKHYRFELTSRHQVRVLFSPQPSASVWRPIALLMPVRQDGEDPDPLGMGDLFQNASHSQEQPGTSDSRPMETVAR